MYGLTHTSRDDHHLVGYSLLKDRDEANQTEQFYFFKDFSDPASEFVSRVPFSVAGRDLVLVRNSSNWYLNIPRHNGEAELVENPSVNLVSMQSREEHGEWWEERPTERLSLQIVSSVPGRRLPAARPVEEE